MPRYRWIEPPVQTGKEELSALGLLGEILGTRGVRSLSDARAFLGYELDAIPDPATLPDIDAAVMRIRQAIRDDERIAVFGDYDVDGVTSTAMLTGALSAMGAEVQTYLPHRERDGYGLNHGAVERAASDGCRLLITVDCGSSNHAELERAAKLGLGTIVVDHHHVPDGRLPADAFVSPRRPDSIHPFADYAAVGVTWQLLRHLAGDDRVDAYLPIVALGTVADVVPLVGPNRVIVHHGLRQFATDAGPGLRALAEASGLKPDCLTSHHLGFMLGPRINAAGRIEDPWPALELLGTDSPERAGQLATYLSDLNSRRQRMLQEAIAEAQIYIDSDGVADRPVLVLHSPDWRIGLVGLIASRIAERYNRPVFALEQSAPLSRGSARSIDEFNVVQALGQCADLLEQYGGHSKAAGLTIETNQIAAFSDRINQVFTSEVGPEPPLPSLVLDAELTPEQVSLGLIEELAQLEPCGHGNQPPRFLMRGVTIQESRRSKDQSHLLFNVGAGYGAPPLRAVSFGGGDRLVELMDLPRADIAVSLRPNTWRGRTSVTLEVLDFRSPA